MRLPEDIIRLIVDCVFDVGALDTSPGYTKPASRMSTAFAHESVGGTARALCTASRLFYRICIPRFYEVVAVHDPRLLQSLATSLCVPLVFIEHARGHYCRRLDIDIWIDSYPDWSHGATTLWGLILACPRLEILNVNVVSTSQSLPWDWCLCPLSLLIQIADAYGPRLRRFELRGLVNVHFSSIRYLASRCPHLEILCVPRMFAVEEEYQSDESEDDLDQTEGRVVLPRAMINETMPLMSAEEKKVFSRAHENALNNVRNAPRGRGVELPCLHTLEVGNYIDFTRHWTFPRLRVLHSSFLAVEEYYIGINHCRAVQKSALKRLGARLVAWTVVLSGEIDAWAQLGALPNLKYLGFALDDYEHPPEHPMDCGHASLQEVDLLTPEIIFVAEPWAWLSFLLRTRAALPALRIVRVVGTHLPPEWAQKFADWKSSFARVHVRLEFTPGYLRPAPTMLHVPILDDTFFSRPHQREGIKDLVKLYSDVYPDLVQRLCWKSRGAWELYTNDDQ